jgi:hypothetical protein
VAIHDRSGGCEFGRVREGGDCGCRLDQAVKRRRDEEEGGGHGGTQGARSVGLELELPPERVLVVDVLVGEEQEPDRDDKDRGEHRPPAGRQAVIEQPGAAVELAPTGDEHAENRQQ